METRQLILTPEELEISRSIAIDKPIERELHMLCPFCKASLSAMDMFNCHVAAIPLGGTISYYKCPTHNISCQFYAITITDYTVHNNPDAISNHRLLFEKLDCNMIEKIQYEIEEWVNYNFDSSNKIHPLLGMVEEVGGISTCCPETRPKYSYG